MRLFEGTAGDLAPLLLQLQAPAGAIAYVECIRASGQSASGNASRLAVYRPSTVGTGINGTYSQVGGSGATPLCSFYSSFSANPSTPTLGEGPWNLPLRITWRAPRESAIVLSGSAANGTALCAYATASGGHLWAGEILWEEV